LNYIAREKDQMKAKMLNLLAMAVLVSTASGCASYRTDSNITSAPTGVTSASTPAPTVKVLISEDSLPNRKYKEIGPVEVSVKKLTVFHKDPTKEQANEALTEKAMVIGADAVIDVVYKSGVGFTTWGYMDANGTGVKLIE
jgi:hypothetical protein